MRSLFLLALLTVTYCQVVEKCRVDTYPPPETTKLGWVKVDLNVDPSLRWKEAILPVKQEIKDLIGVITGYVNKYVLTAADVAFGIVGNTLPEPYRSEMKGVADVLEMPFGEIVLYNIFYEIFTVCTSIVAEDPSGKLYHGRNLDFGLFLGWDDKNDTWILTERLRKVLVNVDFVKDGKTQYQSVSFLGYVGLMTAIKPHAFTVTINERFAKDGGFNGIWNWLLGDRSQSWMGFLVRDVAMHAEDYSTAKEMFMKTPLLAPAYYILSGNSSGEGCLITRGRTEMLDIQELDVSKGVWYLLQTNYDNWVEPPFYDDRRTPGKICMKEMGQKRTGASGLFNVLSTKPNLNKLTCYSAILQVDEGLTSWIQDCPNPCTPW